MTAIKKLIENEYAHYNNPEPSVVKKKFAILTCMDPRIIPDTFDDLFDTDVYVIRNAGGRASDDAVRSLIISHKLLGTSEWAVIQHTDCGMQKFTNDVMGCLLQHSLEPATLVKNCNVDLCPHESPCKCLWKDTGKCPGSIVGKYIDWLPILDNLYQSVLDDVVTIRNHPLVPSNIPIYGYIYDIKTHKLIEVPKATKKGRAKPICCHDQNQDAK